MKTTLDGRRFRFSISRFTPAAATRAAAVFLVWIFVAPVGVAEEAVALDPPAAYRSGVSWSRTEEPTRKIPPLLSRSVFKVYYLERDTPVFSSNYLQLVAGFEQNRWLNPAAGFETALADAEEMRSYFLGDTVRLTRRKKLTARLNHVEYPRWQIGANMVDVFYSDESRHWEGSAGLTYQAVVFDPRFYNQPWHFDSEAPELRFIYAWAFRQTFWEQRLGFRAGMFNFTEFEHYGYDLDVFVEPFVRLSPQVKLSFLYEWRQPPIDLLILNRTTLRVGLEIRPGE